MIGTATLLKLRLWKQQHAKKQRAKLNGSVFVGRKHKSLSAATKGIKPTGELVVDSEIVRGLYPTEVK